MWHAKIYREDDESYLRVKPLFKPQETSEAVLGLIQKWVNNHYALALPPLELSGGRYGFFPQRNWMRREEALSKHYVIADGIYSISTWVMQIRVFGIYTAQTWETIVIEVWDDSVDYA